jgi:hypothetical protein
MFREKELATFLTTDMPSPKPNEMSFSNFGSSGKSAPLEEGIETGLKFLSTFGFD